MMRTIAFAVRNDEVDAFERFSSELVFEVKLVEDKLSLDNVELTKGYEAVVFFGMCDLSSPVLYALKANGVKYIASRSAGYNNVDMEVAKELGIKVSNGSYSPNCVADYTVMLILMAIRKMKAIMKRVEMNDYSLPGIQGKEMHNLTFGIIGTGSIGQVVASNLSGFGGRILAYNTSEKEAIMDIVNYVSLETLLSEADVITLHLPLLESTKYILNADTLAKTKEGVVIINTARGELIDTKVLIDFVDKGHVSAVAIDVLENELGIFHHDHRLNHVAHHELAILQSYNNVIVSPHSSFYTDQAVSDMVEVGLRSAHSFLENDSSPYEVK